MCTEITCGHFLDSKNFFLETRRGGLVSWYVYMFIKFVLTILFIHMGEAYVQPWMFYSRYNDDVVHNTFDNLLTIKLPVFWNLDVPTRIHHSASNLQSSGLTCVLKQLSGACTLQSRLLHSQTLTPE